MTTGAILLHHEAYGAHKQLKTIYVDSTKQHDRCEQRIISFCTGYGGIERGLDLAGLAHRTVAYVEIESIMCANLVAAMETGAICPALIWTDLKTFDSKPFHRKIHGITGGYPCQPFSTAGERKGEKDPRHLCPYILEHIRAIRPLWCFFENVVGHLTLGFGEVYRNLSDLGYKIEAGIFSANEVGQSHERQRLFILAVANEINEFTYGGAGIKPSGAESKQDNGPNLWCVSRSKGEMGNAKSKKPGGLPVREKQKFTKSIIKNQLADTDRSGGRESTQSGELRAESVIQSSQYSWRANEGQKSKIPQGVALPGKPQHEWEEPRQITKDVLKSRLGLSVDGYDYRTDFLRSLGNGVVPKTAAKAWHHLNKKMSEQ